MKSDLTKIISLVRNKKIDKFAFVKKGLDVSIKKILGIETYSLLLPPPDINGLQLACLHDRKYIHIGVFANNQLRKNVHNQIAAALMIENALVHTTDKFEYSYFNCDDRIIEHSSGLDWKEFMFLLAQMDINLYNTYTETWGQIVVESIALGVPCLTNNSSGVLDTNEKLKKELIVAEHDNPIAIADQIMRTLEQRDEIVRLGADYISDLNEIAQQKLDAFLY
jgi:glycosyltransferase involved in cell wall biosynthesis